MKVINDQLRDMLIEMAKNDPAISEALNESNEETFDYGVLTALKKCVKI